MTAKLQGTNEIYINSPQEKIWEVLSDSHSYDDWLSVMIKDVCIISNEKTGVGMTRECKVELGKRKGMITEKCIEAIPNEKLSFTVVDDSFGFKKMLLDYHFSLILKPVNPNKTIFRIETFYRPKNFLIGIMNVLLMKKQMKQLRIDVLNALKNYMENKN